MNEQERAALAATPAPAELEKAHEARRQAQSELAYFKARLASARLTLMRELKEQGWAPAPAPLTDEQIDKTAKRVIPVAAYMGMFEYAAFSKEDADRTVRHFARAIEAAHGIGQGKEASNGE